MPQLKRLAEGQYRLEGDVGLEHIPQLKAATFACRDANVRIDLGGIQNADSALVVLMLQWQRACNLGAGELEFINCPVAVKELLYLYDLGSLLKVS